MGVGGETSRQGTRGRQVVSRMGDIYVFNSNALAQGDCQLVLTHLGNVAWKMGFDTKELKYLKEHGEALPVETICEVQRELFQMWLDEEGQAQDYANALKKHRGPGAAQHAMRMRYLSSLHRRFGKKLWFDILCRYQTIPERIIELVNENIARKVEGSRKMTSEPQGRNLESLALQLTAKKREALQRDCNAGDVPFLDAPSSSGLGAEQAPMSRERQQYEAKGKATKRAREDAWRMTKGLVKMQELYCVGDKILH